MKILSITPHLSTGGLPQYLLRKLEHLKSTFEFAVVEWDNISGDAFVVQRNQIRENFEPDNFFSLGENKKQIVEIIMKFQPDVIHFEEIPETFISEEVLQILYSEKRPYNIVVTTHSSYTNPFELKYTADEFVLVSKWSQNRFIDAFPNIKCSLFEYPMREIDLNKVKQEKPLSQRHLSWANDKIHILHVGLFTAGKNQAYIIELAKKLVDYPIEFHFVGNQAENFSDYWLPLMQNLPSNCHVHGERADVDVFYLASDGFLFPSLYELNPLAVKEALEWHLPLFLTKLHTYEDTYDTTARYITQNVDEDCQLLIDFYQLSKPETNMEPISKPIRIQAIHLLTNVTEAREVESIRQLSQLQNYGIDYVQHVNEPYDGPAPAEFCRRPDAVGDTPQDLGNGLGVMTGRHYGCYLAHRDAILSMTDEYDYTLVFEADANIETSVAEFVELIMKAANVMKTNDVYFISFANNPSIGTSDFDEDFHQTAHNQDLAHCYMMPNDKKEWYKERCGDCPWDAADLWLNHVFYAFPQKRFTTNKIYSNQIPGVSLLDNYFKWSDVIEVEKRGVLHRFKPHTSNHDFYAQQFPRWEDETFRIFDEVEDKDGTAIDLGAWVGVTAIWLSKHFKKVIAVEPDVESLVELRDNLIFSDCSNVEIIENPIYSTNETVYFGGHNGNLNISMSKLKGTTKVFDNDYPVLSFTLHDLVTYRPDEKIVFIKCDIEGGEEYIMEDLLTYASRNNIPLYLSFHVNFFENQDISRFKHLFNLFKGRIDCNGTLIDDLCAFLEEYPFAAILFKPQKESVSNTDMDSHYDYVEIGSCDFDTLVETMPDGSKGLTIDAVPTFLRNLPVVENNTKLNYAISNVDGEVIVYYTPDEFIEKYNLPSWMRGCNSINNPHPSVDYYLKQHDLPKTYIGQEVECLSFKTLSERHNIKSIDLLKVDTEGHDFIILRSMIDNTLIRPTRVQCEANSLYTPDEIHDFIEFMQENNYLLFQQTQDDLVFRLRKAYVNLPPIAVQDVKPILIISSGRRFEYFEKTINALVEKNPGIQNMLKSVWVLDDRSTIEDRASMELLMQNHFGDKANMICFNSNEPFKFVDKFKMIKNLITPSDVVFLLEDDWECHDEMHLEFHLNNLLENDWTQIAFCDPFGYQPIEIQKSSKLNVDYWRNPFPEFFRHPHKWDGDICHWAMGRINHYTNNPSLIKGELFFRGDYVNDKNFEWLFAEQVKGNQVFTVTELFRHFGENSLINQL
jgi:FkbM family methyltransferase